MKALARVLAFALSVGMGAELILEAFRPGLIFWRMGEAVAGMIFLYMGVLICRTPVQRDQG